MPGHGPGVLQRQHIGLAYTCCPLADALLTNKWGIEQESVTGRSPVCYISAFLETSVTMLLVHKASQHSGLIWSNQVPQ